MTAGRPMSVLMAEPLLPPPVVGGLETHPRVLMFVPQYPYPVVGGLERQSHELSKALRELGVEVQVMSGRITPDQPGFERVEGVPVFRIPWAAWKPWRFLRAPFDIFFVFWKKRRLFDVVHLHQHSWVGLFVILSAKLLRKPVVTKLPNVGDCGIPGLRRKSLGRLRLAILRQSDGIVAMSRQSEAELRAIGYPAARILTVANGIALSDRPGGNGQAKDPPCRVAFVGRLSEQKRLDSLLTAWRRVVGVTGAAARLELWGEGPLKAELKQQCDEFGLKDSVFFAGHLDGVRERLRCVDIFVLPSRVEGNSNAVLEAMEAGLPIVATPVGGTPMQVGAAGAALLFDVGDAEVLAQRLLTLIQDPALRGQYGAAMRQRVETHFDIRKVARTYRAAYLCLAGKARATLADCGQLPDCGTTP